MSDTPSPPTDPIADFAKWIFSSAPWKFKSELLLRIFAVSQGAGLIDFLYLWFGYSVCVGGGGLSLPTCYGWSPTQLFEAGMWTGPQNWLGVLSVFGPFAVFKSLDWIMSAKR
ncbi:MAG TPA: hypothetical protein VFA75_00310 [Nevskia sp.]|nr:hypothetical protein [Nevskia sp.]